MTLRFPVFSLITKMRFCEQFRQRSVEAALHHIHSCLCWTCATKNLISSVLSFHRQNNLVGQSIQGIRSQGQFYLRTCITHQGWLLPLNQVEAMKIYRLSSLQSWPWKFRTRIFTWFSLKWLPMRFQTISEEVFPVINNSRLAGRLSTVC